MQEVEIGHFERVDDEEDDLELLKPIPYRIQHTRQRRLEKVRAFKAGKSCRCGEDDQRCLDLHHRDPSTKHKALRSGGGGWRDIALRDLDSELAKCDVICANCHRKEHNGGGDIRHLL